MAEYIFLLDGDDVLLKTGEEKVRWLREHLTDNDITNRERLVLSIRPSECSRTFLVPIISEATYNDMVEFVYSRDGTLRIAPLDDALVGVQYLSTLGDVYVASARTIPQAEITREWLIIHGFYKHLAGVSSTEDKKYAGVSPVEGSKKVGIAVHLGAHLFVDDDVRHMPQNPVDGLDCLLFGPLERTVGRHIIIARTWDDIMEYAGKFE